MGITAENNKRPSPKEKATNIMQNLKIKTCDKKIKVLPG